MNNRKLVQVLVSLELWQAMQIRLSDMRRESIGDGTTPMSLNSWLTQAVVEKLARDAQGVSK